MLKKNIFYKLNKKKIFFISIVICFGFYFLEYIVGIDRFYHPDSLHYLNSENDPILILNLQSISSIFNIGYYYLVKIFNYNYGLSILFNFFLYSLSNVIIFQKIFKQHLKRYNNLNLLILIYLLFLDPYRLHLTCHVLKETTIIFIFTLFFFDKLSYARFFLIPILEIFRKNSLVYLLVFFRMKMFFDLIHQLKKNKNLKYIFLTFILILSLSLTLTIIITGSDNLLSKIDWTLKHYHYREMPIRNYDFINNFQGGIYSDENNFYTALFLKLLSWTLLLISGLFIFFTDSFLFQALGIFIILNHLFIYKITKKTYIDIGLIFLILVLAIYSTSFTAFFRYCYIGLYFSIINFFYNLNHNEK